ncbi:MAG: hypothetical protein ACJ76J_28200 [Thermoanaerobaculia bacterium]
MGFAALLERLRGYRAVLVVGPQRAGTTIAARMLAGGLGTDFLDERDVDGDLGQRIDELRHRKTASVVQCPGWTWTCHELGGRGIGVVLLRRAIEEVIDSQERIRWTRRCQPQELRRYGLLSGAIAEVKYRAWDEHQRRALGPHAHELAYTALAEHPLWLDSGLRKGFHPKQTSLGEG